MMNKGEEIVEEAPIQSIDTPAVKNEKKELSLEKQLAQGDGKYDSDDDEDDEENEMEVVEEEASCRAGQQCTTCTTSYQ